MNPESMNALVGRLSAHEAVLTLLLAEQFKSLPPSDLIVFRAALNPDDVPSPPHPDLDAADHLAGRTIVYKETMNRLLGAAQEIAGQ